MRCHSIQPLLSALADRELGGLLAWRVKRHISRCPACAAELQAIERITKDAQAWRTEPASTDLQQRIQTALTVGKEKPMNAVCLPNPLYRRALITPRRVVIALLAVIAICAVTFAPRPSRSYIAFADVIKAMEEVKTISWIETSTQYSQEGQQERTTTSECWARFDQPALAYRELKPGAKHDETALKHSTTRSIIDSQGSRSYDVGSNLYCVSRPWWSKNGKDGLALLIKSFIYSPDQGQQGTTKAQQTVKWAVDATLIQGKRAILFTSESKTDADRILNRIYVDPATHYIVKAEFQIIIHEILRAKIVRDSYTVNGTPPAGIFGLKVPNNCIEKMRNPMATLYVPQLSTQERKLYQPIVNEMLTALRDKNFTRFSSVWDYDYVSTLGGKTPGTERRHQWAMTVQKPRLKWQSYRGEAIMAEPCRKFSVGPWEIFKVPEDQPDIIMLTVKTYRKPEGSPVEQQQREVFYLRKTDKGFKFIAKNLL